MTQKQLEALLAEWQAVLRLQDWAVKARFAEPELLGGGVAHCCTTSPRKLATIRIASPETLSRDGDAERDPEADLVHELIHLHMDAFAPADWTSPTGVAMEQAIDLIAEALVKLKRATKKKRR